MRFVPDSPNCDECDGPATIHLCDTSAGTEHIYCPTHRPDVSPGKRPEFTIVRYRLLNRPDSRMLAAPEDSQEHQSLRSDLCDLQILYGQDACLYYLSNLTSSDQFALWSDEFVANLREFVLTETRGAAAYFRFDVGTVDYMAPLLKRAYKKVRPGNRVKLTKQDLAIDLVLRNPRWSDKQIAENAPTTTSQLQRFSDYKALRAP